MSEPVASAAPSTAADPCSFCWGLLLHNRSQGLAFTRVVVSSDTDWAELRDTVILGVKVTACDVPGPCTKIYTGSIIMHATSWVAMNRALKASWAGRTDGASPANNLIQTMYSRRQFVQSIPQIHRGCTSGEQPPRSILVRSLASAS
ncbi:hypothetical protein FA95DRAFT_982497 [Auriscalpium vulgare]|uniref:Uncharacterized protein n=1 Tax=Auriscalpium vulgare TaxID=40419 RepID=A0ACB8R706_9AGAM|nr:hypothetical protein FA95DRAFT_982497 [Auriscalpium vulgare]